MFAPFDKKNNDEISIDYDTQSWYKIFSKRYYYLRNVFLNLEMSIEKTEVFGLLSQLI